MKRRIALVFVLSLSILGLTIGCSQEQTAEAQDVTWEQLLSSPGKYSGRYVAVEGFYFSGFEVIVLSEKLEYSGYAEGHLIPKGIMVWIEGGIPHEVHDKLHKQSMMGPSEHYGKVRITGKFEYGKRYGHLGGYEYQISPAMVEILPWSPD